jgi:glycosidase
MDTNGDGVGDLRGVIARLDHLQWLGVDGIWLDPITTSPNKDWGYDVSDYCGVDPALGTLADAEELVAEAAKRGIRVMLDLVPNHSSDQHPWFRDAISSRDSEHRDWYVWADPKPDGSPPNNWVMAFDPRVPAWTFDKASGQYYLNQFLSTQPDLNWWNEDVRDAFDGILRFWFDRGVDGFRIDVLWHLLKAADFPDNPPNPAYRPGMGEMHRLLQRHSTDQPEVHGIAAAMRDIADSYGARGLGERVLIGEIYLPVDRLMHYYGRERLGVHLPFNFQLIDTPWEARALAAVIADYETALPLAGWPNWVLGNHDRPRVATRRGQAQARVAAVLLLTLRGTPTLYYGDELGLSDVAIESSQVQDPRELREPGLALGRDPVRTPMPWDERANAGFTTNKPWLPLNADWPTRNVARMTEDSHSILTLYRRLLVLRRDCLALSIGDFVLLDVEGDILAYARRHGEERLIVALNLGEQPHRLQLPDWARGSRLLLSTLSDAALVEDGALLLRSNEAVVLKAG